MSKRRDELRALLSNAPKPAEEARAGEGAPAPDPVPEARPERASSGAVKAMGLQLGNLRAGADEAKALRETLSRGEAVIEIDPARIEPAFVADRLHPAGLEDDRFEALKDSIRSGGQEVPVLVRPHPDPARAKAGDYQAAYGHRRIAAARALGLPVRAVVRALSDEALVVAQGKENAERRDLSFIERAFFAKALIERGFERRVAESALAIHKTEMTRLLQVADAVPRHLVEAIGPAPRVGRPRWLALAERLEGTSAQVKAQDEIGSERFRAAPTDERFALVLQRLTQAAPKTGEPVAVERGGQAIATLTRAKRATKIEIAAPDFAEFVARRLPELHAAFEAEREAKE